MKLKSSLIVLSALAALACTVDANTSDGSGGSSTVIPDGGGGGKADGFGGGAPGGTGGVAGASGAAGEVGLGGSAGSADAGTDAAITPACSELDPRTVPAEVAVLPDAGETPFVSVLATATSSIDVMVYQMGYGGVLDTITQKATDGVKVRVILDVSQKSVNQKYYDTLTTAGAQVEWSDSGFTYMHAKLILVDGSTAVISTGNYLKSFMLKERNFVVTDRDPWDMENLTSLFEADWNRLSPSLDCTRLLVSPINAKERILIPHQRGHFLVGHRIDAIRRYFRPQRCRRTKGCWSRRASLARVSELDRFEPVRGHVPRLEGH